MHERSVGVLSKRKTFSCHMAVSSFPFPCYIVTISKGLCTCLMKGHGMGMDQVWLGANRIEGERNRVVLPENVFKLGVADLDAALFWAYNTEIDAIVISWLQDEFTHKDRFEIIDDSMVSERGMAVVPRQVMSQYPGFDNGERLHFVTISNQADEDRCMVLPTEVARDRFDVAGDGLFSGDEE